MNKFCHTGFSQIQELYNQHVEQIDSALQHCKETPCTNGMAGEPVPYQLRNDFAITGIVFLCFFLVTYSLKNGQKYLYQHIKSFSDIKNEPDSLMRVPDLTFATPSL